MLALQYMYIYIYHSAIEVAASGSVLPPSVNDMHASCFTRMSRT